MIRVKWIKLGCVTKLILKVESATLHAYFVYFLLVPVLFNIVVQIDVIDGITIDSFKILIP